MADDRSPYPERIRDSAAEAITFVSALRGLKSHRPQTLERCIQNVMRGKAAVTSLKVIDGFNLFNRHCDISSNTSLVRSSEDMSQRNCL